MSSSPTPKVPASTTNRAEFFLDKPPHLIKASTIFIGSCGYIQIGFLLELDDANDVVCHLRALFVLNGSWMLMKTEEVHNLFIFLRKQEECKGVDGVDGNLPDSDEEFMGTFLLRKHLPTQLSRVILYYNYHSRKEGELIFPSVAVMREVLSLENIIDGHLFRKFVFKNDTCDEITSKLARIASDCRRATYIKDLAADTTDSFIIDLATNMFSFFILYFEMKKN